MTAELLIENFGDIKTVKQAVEAQKKEEIETYKEPSDADLWADWYAANREVASERAKNVNALYSKPSS